VCTCVRVWVCACVCIYIKEAKDQKEKIITFQNGNYVKKARMKNLWLINIQHDKHFLISLSSNFIKIISLSKLNDMNNDNQQTRHSILQM